MVVTRPQKYEEIDHGPHGELHEHEVNGGRMVHRHPVGDPSYKDGFKEPHSHLIVLHERNYVWEDSGPATVGDEF